MRRQEALVGGKSAVKTLRIIFLAAFVAALTLAVGCNKEDEGPAPVRREEVKPPDEVPAVVPQAPKDPGDAQGETKPPSYKPAREVRGRSLLKAPSDYFGAVFDARKRALFRSAVAQMKRDMPLFKQVHERHPESLEEFKKWRGGRLPELPHGIEYWYDPETGEWDIVDPRLQE